jgi:hypothetical protein
MGWLDDLEVVADKGLEWKSKCEALTAERDQLRAQLETASGNARHYADRCTALEAEVERLRGDVANARALAGRNLTAYTAATARAEAAEGRAAGLYRALCDAVRASGGVANDGISDTFLILGVPSEMAARKKAQEAAESTVAGLRRALEVAECYIQIFRKDYAIAKRDFEGSEDQAEIDGDLKMIAVALAATSDEHERWIKSESLREVARAASVAPGAKHWEWDGLYNFIISEADRLEREAANG